MRFNKYVKKKKKRDWAIKPVSSFLEMIDARGRCSI